MNARKKQQEMNFGRDHEARREHGGDVGQGLRKLHRPLNPELSLHVVMRSSKAKGHWALSHRRNRSNVEQILRRHAEKNAIVLYSVQLVGNHLHLLIKFKKKESVQKFFRIVAGLIPRAITGAQKGYKVGRFWDKTLYSRMVTWGREFKAVCAYLGKNALESVGFYGVRLKLTKQGQAVAVFGRARSEEEKALVARAGPEVRRWYS